MSNEYLRGLLGDDELETAKQDALKSSLLMAGLQGLMASGPSLMPTSAGQVLGQAGMAGVQSYGNAMQQAERQALQGREFDQMMKAQKSDDAFKAALPQIFQNGKINYDMVKQLSLVNPEQMGKVMTALNLAKPPKGPAPVNLQFDAKTGTVFNPRTGDVTFAEGFGAQPSFNVPEGATPEETAKVYIQQGQRLAATDPQAAKQYFDLADKVNPQPKKEKPTDGQLMASGYFERMNQAQQTIKPLEEAGDYPMYGAAIAGSIPFAGDFAKNITMSPEQQRYQQAADDWIRSKLRKESGAVIGEDEMAREYRTYFPQPGDSDAVIKQKREARETATKAMLKAAGPAVPSGIQRTEGKQVRLRFNPETGQLEEQ